MVLHARLIALACIASHQHSHLHLHVALWQRVATFGASAEKMTHVDSICALASVGWAIWSTLSHDLATLDLAQGGASIDTPF